MSIEITDVEGLLSEDLVTELGESLVQLERLNLAILLLDLIGYLVGALGAEPLVCPLLKVNITIGMTLIVASLKRGNEVMKIGVCPGELLEVDLKSLTKCFPSHLIDKLFKQAGTFAIGDTVYQRF